MIRSAIIFFLVNYCAFLFSQTPTLSRRFDAFKKNVPLAILNTHAHYFHVLRYNKEIHDFTLERRDKASAEMLSFNPLKLDLINADWFNYEYLDYLLFESNNKVYFLFEKVTNSRREIFLKEMDTTGKSGDFIQLAVLDKEKGAEDFNFKFKITEDKKVLIVGSQTYNTGITKKVVMLYDPEKLEKILVKKLPVETTETGTTYGFECNARGDLFYVILKPRVASYRRKYVDHKQQEVPVFAYDIEALVSELKNGPVHKVKLANTNVYQVYSLSLYPTNNEVSLVMHYTKLLRTEEEAVCFFTQKWPTDLGHSLYNAVTPLDSLIDKKLTYYDGTDFKSASDKDFSLVSSFCKDNTLYSLSERKDENFYKELFLLKVDLSTGAVLSQQLIPRKLLFYKGRSRYKTVNESAQFFCEGNYQALVLENPRNLGKLPQDYKYKRFAKVGGVKGAALVSYSLKNNGELEKKALYENGNYEFIPLLTQSSGCEFVFYLTNGVYERFATLNLNL